MAAPTKHYFEINEEVCMGAAWSVLVIYQETNIVTGAVSDTDISGWEFDLYVKENDSDADSAALIHVTNDSVIVSSTGGTVDDTILIPVDADDIVANCEVGKSYFILVTSIDENDLPAVEGKGLILITRGKEAGA